MGNVPVIAEQGSVVSMYTELNKVPKTKRI